MARPRRPHGLVKALVAAAHEAGLSVTEAASRIGCTRQQVYSTGKRLGLSFPGVRKYNLNPRPSRT